MTRIDDVNFEIVIEDRFSFRHNVLPILENIKEEVSDLLEDGKYDEDIVENINEFIKSDEITNEQIIEILAYIRDDYEYESYNSEHEVSIFDEDRIRKSINDWIEDQFNFRPDEL